MGDLKQLVTHITGELQLFSTTRLQKYTDAFLRNATMSLSNKLSITDVDLKGKRVLIRV